MTYTGKRMRLRAGVPPTDKGDAAKLNKRRQSGGRKYGFSVALWVYLALQLRDVVASGCLRHPVEMTSQLHAFAFQTGNWRVRHTKLVERLSACTDWIEFGGTCQAYEVLNGGGNVDDFFIDDPAGAYRAATFRRMSPAADEWSIYWADARRDNLDLPMHGRFEGGVGVFRGRDRFAGRDIQVRFVWSDIGPDTARWEQAFSTDGVTWEVNWVMRFEREEHTRLT